MEEIANIQCYIYTWKKTLNDNIIYKRYCQHLCYHFCYLSKNLVPGVHMEYISEIILSFFNIIFSNIMITLADIYFSINTYGSLLSNININWWRINIQDYMLDHPVGHDISIGTYKWVREGINRQNLMPDFHRENNTSWKENL